MTAINTAIKNTMTAPKISPHTFYIPVMGTGFTIDTPLAVAKYGISSVIPLLDDVLIEQMRKFWCEKSCIPYDAISAHDRDHRAKRITAYLNLILELVENSVKRLKLAPFTPTSEITHYYEMLPDCTLKQNYQKMLLETNMPLKLQQQEQLRQAVSVGAIDVNIMTKVDGQHFCQGQSLPYEFCDAAAALRGFANSKLSSTVIFSAGFNPHLYGYLTNFADFFPDDSGESNKKVCLKVSDYRSAEVQGKYLAKHGIWVSEFRVESPLNCGGHAFINDGHLLGPILEEFKQRKDELIETLHGFYQKALNNLKKFCKVTPRAVQITAQGGIGTNAEHDFLLCHYGLAGAGWGTPFLLVPEVTNVDEQHLQKLLQANSDDVFLSTSSPLGVPFWNLRNSASELARTNRIAEGKPGSFCIKGYAKLHTNTSGEFVCLASRDYQSSKLQDLENSNLPAEQVAALKEDILSKSCICHDLAGSVTIKNGIDLHATPSICPGPMSLKEIVDHIYGRCNVLANNGRAHMFITELKLQIKLLLEDIKKNNQGLPSRSTQKLNEVKENINDGIKYYREIAKDIFKENQNKFLQALDCVATGSLDSE
jgi:hypothetical protein